MSGKTDITNSNSTTKSKKLKTKTLSNYTSQNEPLTSPKIKPTQEITEKELLTISYHYSQSRDHLTIKN